MFRNKRRLSVLSIVLGILLILPFSGAAADINVVELTALQARKDLDAKKYTVRQLTEAFLARIEKYNPGYNAIISMNPNALKEAEDIDRRLAAGEKPGPLTGIPVVIKDTIDIAGLPTTCGWKPLSAKAGGKDILPELDSTVVKLLRKNGVVILGKTNVPIFSMSGTDANNSWAGPTYNAASPAHAPGASSSGTATAVSGSFAVLGLAEETGGSIQNPAAAQGLVGVKPTFALVPNTGVVPLAGSTRDVIGPHAKSVYDAALVMDALAGFDSEDLKTVAAIGKRPKGGYAGALNETALKGKRIGLYGPGWKEEVLTPDVAAKYAQVIEHLKKRGATVVEDPFNGSGFTALRKPGVRPNSDSRGQEYCPYEFQVYLERLGKAIPGHTLAEFTKFVGADAFAAGGPFEARRAMLPAFLETLANPSTPPDMTPFLVGREAYLEIFDRVMDEKKLDALVFPQMYMETPPLFGTELIGATTSAEINISGLPGVVVPAGYFDSGAPFSIIIVGRQWDEANLLSLAYDFEQSTKARKTPELIENPASLAKK